MKIVFKDLGTKKFSKIIEVTSLSGFQNIKEFCSMEIEPHLPDRGDFELVPTDGLPELISRRYVIVYTDEGYVTRGMGHVLVYD